LDKFGFGDLNTTEDDLSKEDFVVQLGYSPYRIDILTGVSGLNFEDAFRNKMLQKIANK
jgi:hypothetical protein